MLQSQVSTALIYVSFALHRAGGGYFGFVSSQSHHLTCCLTGFVSRRQTGGRHSAVLSLLSMVLDCHPTRATKQIWSRQISYEQRDDLANCNLRVRCRPETQNGIGNTHTTVQTVHKRLTGSRWGRKVVCAQRHRSHGVRSTFELLALVMAPRPCTSVALVVAARELHHRARRYRITAVTCAPQRPCDDLTFPAILCPSSATA